MSASLAYECWYEQSKEKKKLFEINKMTKIVLQHLYTLNLNLKIGV